MTAMELKVVDHGKVSVVAMSGDLEVDEIGDFKSVMDEIAGRGGAPRVVLDLSGVTRLTSYVVALVGYYNAHLEQTGGRLVLAGAPAAARRSFDLSGMTSVLHLAETTGAAVRELGG